MCWVTTHYSKSRNFVQKFNFKNPNIFTSFSPKFFLTIFLVKSKLSTAKKSKTAAFSRVFTQNFSREVKFEFLDKKWRFRTVWVVYIVAFVICNRKNEGIFHLHTPQDTCEFSIFKTGQFCRCCYLTRFTLHFTSTVRRWLVDSSS